MKKFIFLMGIGIFFLVSCSSNKKISGDVNSPDLSQSGSISGPGNFIKDSLAKLKINGFRHHKYRGWRNKHVKNGWVFFDPSDLKQIINDPTVDSIKFFYAVELKNKKRDSTNVPTLVIQILYKQETDSKGSITTKPTQYLSPIKICPPPQGCTLMSSQ